jgi:cell division septal protein FtsQ
MNRRPLSRSRQQEINRLYSTTRKKTSRKTLIRWSGWSVLILFSLVAMAFGTHLAWQTLLQKALFENPRYALKEIEVETEGTLSRRQVLQAAQASIGQNMLRMNLKLVQRNVERLPSVAEAEVERQLPGKLVIRVKERVPLARVWGRADAQGNRTLYYVDREGVVMVPRSTENSGIMPALLGVKADDLEPGQKLDQIETLAAINLLKCIPQTKLNAWFDVKLVDVAQPMMLRVETPQGQLVQFRTDHIPEQLQRLTEIYEFARRNQREIRTVDLTVERNVPVTFANTQ